MKTAKTYVLEFLLVVVGILIAFSLNQCNEGRKERNRVHENLDGIAREVQSNYSIIQERVNYHDSLLHVLSSNPVGVRISIKPAETTNYAWQIFQQSGLSHHIKYDLFVQLTKVYHQQAQLEKHNEMASNLMGLTNVGSGVITEFLMIQSPELIASLKNKEEPGIWQKSWVPIFQDMVYYEHELSQTYPELLEKLKTAKLR